MLVERFIINCLYLMSLKDKGNQAFKSQKYKQAIKLYDQYVIEQHSDNKNAFVNMGLCYTKLKDHLKSIQAYKSAIALDPTYQKAYYRLMKEYQQVGNPYEVFINARLYIKNEKDLSSTQINQAKELMNAYKTHFITRSNKILTPKKLQDKDDIFELIKPLQPNPETNKEFNQQIDKYPNEWIEEWKQGIQSDDAKWEEIAYIIKQIDYNTGISLAYFYLNQITNPQKRKIVAEQIKLIKYQMRVQNAPIGEDYEIEQSTQPQQQEIETQFSSKEETSNSQGHSPLKVEQIDSNQQQQMIQEVIASPPKTFLNENKPEKINKIQEMLQKKSQYKKIYEQNQEKNQKSQVNTDKRQSKPIADLQRQIKTAQKQPQKVQEKAPINSLPIKPEKSQQQIDQLYKTYCGNLQKTKDIFADVYKSIFTILNSKEEPATKGKLLILIKKRVKKFKMIVASFSDNEQKVVIDLLSKNGMDEYGVDFAPKFYKA